MKLQRPALLAWLSLSLGLGPSSAVGQLNDQPLTAAPLISEPVSNEPTTTEQLITSLQEQIDALKLQTAMAPLPGPAKPAKPKYPDYKISGVFQIDSAYFAQSAASIATLGDIEDGTAFRRARFGISSNMSERVSCLMEFDMAQTQARFVDVWGQVADTPLGNMRIGRFRQPFGMDELTGIRDLPFLERASAFAFTAFRQTGIMFFDTVADDRITWAVSGYRTISDNFGNVIGDSGGYGTAERLTMLAVDHGDCGLVHFGFDHNYLNPARDQLLIATADEIFIGQNPSLGPGGLSVLPVVGVPPFVNSGLFTLDYANVFNVEAAASVGRGLLQSEFRWTNVALPTGENVTLPSGYLTLRWVLTGEVIPYNRRIGVFGRVKPNCPLDINRGHWGAWEVAARVSTIDLNPLFGQPGITGPTRRLTSGSLVLNWYCFNNAKTQVEWVNGSLDDPVQGGSVTNTFAGRVQFDF